MRPTFSIIVFTTLSGIGYGLLFLIGLGLMLGWPTGMQAVRSANAGEVMLDPRIGLGLAIAAGFVFSSAGLMASVAHLGKPLRAWRAFSQWRSSWLSREGISAVVTTLMVLAIAALLLVAPDLRGALRVLGVLLAAGSAFTVFCTARIYSSLAPIRAWHNRYTLPGYLLLGLYGGALWFCALHVVALDGGGRFASWVPRAGSLSFSTGVISMR
jgi:DMSO reductase anchor subunit